MGIKSPDPFKAVFECVHTLGLPAEMFLRGEFGERYLNWIRFISSLLIINFFLGFLRFFHSLPLVGGGVYPQINSYFWWAFVSLSCYHLIRIWLRNRRGVKWHSYSFGISHFAFLGLSDGLLYRVVEPMIAITASLLMRPYSSFTANWILISAICLFIKNNMLFNHMRGRVLDVIDGQIEAEVMSGKMEGKSKKQTAGWSQIVSVSPSLDVDEETDEVATVDDFEATVAALMDKQRAEQDAIGHLDAEREAQARQDAQRQEVERTQTEEASNQ
ncbi:MAG: hypothetical protein AAF702_05055 [Chloroflexota bacterium]